MTITTRTQTSTHRERERKYIWPDDPPAATRRPRGHRPGDIEFLAAPNVELVLDRDPYRLDATYYDTADLRLARQHITLRHRVGDDDPGWHLKVPLGAHDRLEVRHTDQPEHAEVPEELSTALAAVALGAPLVAVADLVSIRTEQHLIDGNGRELAVISFDQVRARRRLEPTCDTSWSELEVELTHGDRSDLARADRTLRRQGLEAAPWWSKLAHAVGQDAAMAAEPADPVLTYLDAQARAWVIEDIGLRLGQVDSVHDLRVAIRRIRATLATFRPLLEASMTEPLRADLKPIGQTLGHLRDSEVLTEQLLTELDHVAPDLDFGPVRSRITRELHAQQLDAQRAVDVLLDSPGYLDALSRLQHLINTDGDHPRSGAAHLRRRARHARRRVQKADRAVRVLDADDDRRDARLHDVRKAAKRARYAYEAVEPAQGKSARHRAQQMEAIQDALGQQHDTVATRAALRAMASRATNPDESAFTYGLLYGRQEAANQQAHGRYEHARRKAL